MNVTHAIESIPVGKNLVKAGAYKIFLLPFMETNERIQ